MVKKISVIALAGMLALPALSLAGGGSPNVADMEQKIEALSRQLDELRAAMAAQSEMNKALAENVEALDKNVGILDEDFEDLDERAEEWDLAARFKFYGDFRARGDYYSADTVFGRTLDNETVFTNRFRLNMRVKATENVEFKGRLAMYKTWGNQSAFTDESYAMWPVFDGNVTRTPIGSSALYVDRAFVNWNNIGGAPIWFSIGRRPTTDGPPGQMRLGSNERLATPMAFMDWPFDGLSLGYGWNWGAESLGTGKLRFCYGRGFEAGLVDDSTNNIKDMDFGGFSWDIMKKGDRFAYVQSFLAMDVFNYPNFQDPIINQAFGDMSGMGDRKNLGDILHTSGVYQDKIAGFNYFVSGGWSRTMPDNDGLFNDPFSGHTNTNDEDGYSFYAGLRYDLEEAGWKFGAEFNYGSQYWLAMSPGHDEIYQSKLATRGQVYEIYTIWDLPTGEKISKYAKTFMRLGYQHYEYDYFGTGDWNMMAYDLGDPGDLGKIQMMGQDPVEKADQIYLTFEAYF